MHHGASAPRRRVHGRRRDQDQRRAIKQFASPFDIPVNLDLFSRRRIPGNLESRNTRPRGGRGGRFVPRRVRDSRRQRDVTGRRRRIPLQNDE